MFLVSLTEVSSLDFGPAHLAGLFLRRQSNRFFLLSQAPDRRFRARQRRFKDRPDRLRLRAAGSSSMGPQMRSTDRSEGPSATEKSHNAVKKRAARYDMTREVANLVESLWALFRRVPVPRRLTLQA